MRDRIKYSQNFLKNTELVKSLIAKSGISANNTVLEIGAGEGIITREILKVAKKVIAFEIDSSLFDRLSKTFPNETKLELKFDDFLQFPLPDYPYKVFSNIPFNITSAVIKKLTSTENPPTDSFLIVQKEAAKMFVGNSLKAILIYPWFELKTLYEFNRSDFSPAPKVDIVLLEIKKREKSLVDNALEDKFQDFVTYTFNKPSPKIPKPSQLTGESWIGHFSPSWKITGTYTKMLKDQEKIEKINRTRVDKNWRKY